MARIMINHVPHHQDNSDLHAINHINQIKLTTYSGDRFISLSPTASGILSNPIGGRRVLAQVTIDWCAKCHRFDTG